MLQLVEMEGKMTENGCIEIPAVVIELLDHGNPHGTATTRQLELVFILNVFIEFQCFFQRQDISKYGHFQHTRKAKALYGCPKFPHRHVGTELTRNSRCYESVYRTVVIIQRFDDRDDVLPSLKSIELARIDAGLTANALAFVIGYAIFPRL